MNGGRMKGNRSGATHRLPGRSDQADVASYSDSEVSAPVLTSRPLHVMLREADSFRLRRQCAQAGMPATRYVSTLLADVEAGRTQIAGKDAVEALAQSNYQLSWIGRNLRELLRKLDACAGPQKQTADALGLQEVIGSLKAHLLRASTVLADIETTRCARPRGASRAGRSRRTASRA